MECFMNSTGHSWLWGSFRILLYTNPSHLHTRLSYMLWCMTFVSKWTESHFPLSFLPSSLRPLDPSQPRPKGEAPANALCIINMGGRDLVRQELQELREKQSLANVWSLRSQWQSANVLCCGQGELENEGMGNTLKRELVLLSFWRKGFSCSSWSHFCLHQMMGFSDINYLPSCKYKNKID